MFYLLDNIVFNYYCNNDEIIGGPSRMVKIDETHIFRNKRYIGQKMIGESYWIVGGIDKNSKNILWNI